MPNIGDSHGGVFVAYTRGANGVKAEVVSDQNGLQGSALDAALKGTPWVMAGLREFMQTTEVLEETGQTSESPRTQGAGRSRWLRAAVLTLVGLVAAWSWLFVVSKWGPASRIDILTFKAGITSKIMRTLLKEGQSAGGHHSHTSAMISGIYATPAYYAMTEQNQEAAKYQPEKFAVFYLFEDIHMGALPKSPPMAMLHLDDGRQVSSLDTEVLRDSFHHRATVVRFPAADAQANRCSTRKHLPSNWWLMIRTATACRRWSGICPSSTPKKRTR